MEKKVDITGLHQSKRTKFLFCQSVGLLFFEVTFWTVHLSQFKQLVINLSFVTSHNFIDSNRGIAIIFSIQDS